MRLGGAGARRRALADRRLAADQRRLAGVRARAGDRRVDGVDVVAVDRGDDVPAVGLEALRRVVDEPRRDRAVDRDAVVVVDRDQLVELPGAGERARLVADPFHQAAVAEEHVGMVVDDVVAVAVELGGEELFRERHADGVGQALAERAGRRLDAGRDRELGVAGRLAVQLAEVAQLREREVVAGQVQQRIEQHRAVPVREHEAVAAGPARIGRVVAQVPAPERDRDLGHAHRRARVAGVRLLDRVHREGADRVGHQARRAPGRGIAPGARALAFDGRAVRGNDRGHCRESVRGRGAFHFNGRLAREPDRDNRADARPAPDRRPARLRGGAAGDDDARRAAIDLPRGCRGGGPQRRRRALPSLHAGRAAGRRRAGGDHRRRPPRRIAPRRPHLAGNRGGDARRLRLQPRRRQLGTRRGAAVGVDRGVRAWHRSSATRSSAAASRRRSKR